MNKQEAIQVMHQINEAYGTEEFITVYFNIGKEKDLRWCNDSEDAIGVINGLSNKVKIAIEVDDIFVENLGDLEEAWKELDGEEDA